MNQVKKFKLKADEIIELIPSMGCCYASDKITVEGLPVKYMYREEPDSDLDSGWCFFSGKENQEYADDPDNTSIFEVNTIANYDRSIIPYLELPFGTELEKVINAVNFEIIYQ